MTDTSEAYGTDNKRQSILKLKLRLIELMDKYINIRTQTQYGKVTDRDKKKNPETSLFGLNNANPVASK